MKWKTFLNEILTNCAKKDNKIMDFSKEKKYLNEQFDRKSWWKMC